MARAILRFALQSRLDNGAILDMRIWEVPSPVPPSEHRYKYALFYGRAGERLVLFDNERGKGDHKHILEVESAYLFETPERLIADFEAEVRAIEGRSE